ncbi:MAG TPA: hypothetical protein VHX42_02640 [Candidatus Babeliales bacterium]|nr:hypothetical protein [Candidatus Babeliales bacterium]
MKRMILFFVMSFFCMNSNLRAMNVYNAMSNAVVHFGQLIDASDNLPLIGKLTNLLPFGMISTSCQQYPGQTMMFGTAMLLYILSYHEAISFVLNGYKTALLEKLGIQRAYNVRSDDTLFIFEGDDEDDAEEQMEMEDELLDENYWNNKKEDKPAIKFI